MKKLVLAWLLSATAVFAQGTSQEAVVSVTPSVVGQVFGTAGWTFQVNGAIDLMQLGAFTNVVVGQGPTIAVGLWSSDGTLLRSAAVSAAGQLVNNSYYNSVEPLRLVPAQTYHIGVFAPVVGGIALSLYDGQAGDTITLGSQVQLGGYAESTGGTFAFPTPVPNGQNAMWVGANFRYTPEPSTAALAGMGFAIVFGLRKRLSANR